MKIGYPCVNRTLGCAGAKTFRLKSYSLARLDETVGNNLECLETMLRFNVEQGILFFRITSDLVPFASHPDVEPPWTDRYVGELGRIGSFVLENGVRIDMHPGQYTLLNAKETRIVENAIRDLGTTVRSSIRWGSTRRQRSRSTLEASMETGWRVCSASWKHLGSWQVRFDEGW